MAAGGKDQFHSHCLESLCVQALRQHVFFHKSLCEKEPGSFATMHWRMEPSIHFWLSGNAGRTANSLLTLLPLSLTLPLFTHAAFLSLLPGERSHHTTLSLLYGTTTSGRIAFSCQFRGKAFWLSVTTIFYP